jgi:hypothetical protein
MMRRHEAGFSAAFLDPTVPHHPTSLGWTGLWMAPLAPASPAGAAAWRTVRARAAAACCVGRTRMGQQSLEGPASHMLKWVTSSARPLALHLIVPRPHRRQAIIYLCGIAPNEICKLVS